MVRKKMERNLFVLNDPGEDEGKDEVGGRDGDGGEVLQQEALKADPRA